MGERIPSDYDSLISTGVSQIIRTVRSLDYRIAFVDNLEPKRNWDRAARCRSKRDIIGSFVLDRCTIPYQKRHFFRRRIAELQLPHITIVNDLNYSFEVACIWSDLKAYEWAFLNFCDKIDI